MWANLLSSSLPTPVTCFFYQHPLFLWLCLNICLYCSHTTLPNFLTLILASAKAKPAGALLSPAWAKPNKDVSIGMWECWTCSWLKWQRFPHCPRPILYTITLISWKETRSCCFHRSKKKKKKAKKPKQKHPTTFYSYAKQNSYSYCNPRTMCYVVKTGARC